MTRTNQVPVRETSSRKSPRYAEKVMKQAFHNPADRNSILFEFLNSLHYAESFAPNAAAVTLFPDGFRLNVGGVEVLTAFSGEIRLLLHTPSERIRAELQNFIQSSPYKSVPGDAWIFRGSVQQLKAYHDDLISAHHRFIKQAGTTKSGRPVKGSPFRAFHSPGLVTLAESANTSELVGDVVPESNG